MGKDLLSDPMRSKLLLAKEIVQRYHDKRVAEEELQWFKKTFSDQQIPKEVPVISLGKQSANAFEILRKCFSSQEKSNSEIRRLIKQGAVRLNNRIVENREEVIFLPTDSIEIKVGKRNWFRIVP